tara:strand:+ start:68 stop:283 length:216 start_codon:yes stop_codon:yes gene_type:complete
MPTTLYKRLKPKFKTILAKEFANRPHSHNALIEMLSNERYFTAIPYGDAYEIMTTCQIEFLGDAFKIDSKW